MSVENNQDLTRNPDDLRKEEDDLQSQKNNKRNIGRKAGDVQEGNGSLNNISEDINKEKPVNEEGVDENQEQHWTGNYGQKSSNKPRSLEQDSFSDQNLTDGVQQNTGRNHVTNVGGTSQEDLEEGKTGLNDMENDS